jgi:hypothetical protein
MKVVTPAAMYAVEYPDFLQQDPCQRTHPFPAKDSSIVVPWVLRERVVTRAMDGDRESSASTACVERHVVGLDSLAMAETTLEIASAVVFPSNPIPSSGVLHDSLVVEASR